MIRFEEHYSLKPYNTFGVEAGARYFFEFTETQDLQEFIRSNKTISEEKILVLGGGSNLLLVDDFDGLVLHPAVPGIETVREDSRQVWLRAGAGVVWDDFVQFVVASGWGGVENLSLIPGNVGATPVQNIGAYGQEAAAVIDSVAGVDLRTGEEWEIAARDCRFGYRNSLFKNELKGRFVITSVDFRVEKFPELKLHYSGLEEEVQKLGEPSVATVRQAVVAIRQSKLPDPATLGNAGSFFKNPVVSQQQADRLIARYPEIPVYPAGEGTVKLSAGWLIDRCGWKGVRRGDAGVHEKHALVLVNYGKASGREIFSLSEEISHSVAETFGVTLEREVNVAGREIR